MINQNTYTVFQWREHVNQQERIINITTGMKTYVKGIFENSVQEVKSLELDDGIDLLDDPSN